MRKIVVDNRIAVFVLGVILVAVAMMIVSQRKSDEVLLATSQNLSAITLQQVECVSIDPNKIIFNRRQYDASKIVPLAVDVLSIQPILSQETQVACPWGLSITILKGFNFGVRYDGKLADYLISIGVCRRAPQGLNPNLCLSKNVYVFGAPVSELRLFKIGLVGLSLPSNGDKMVVHREKVAS